MNFGEMKDQVRRDIWPENEAENLIAIHDRFFVEALFDVQRNVSCYQSNNFDTHPQCASYFNCGMTVLPAPRGHILSVSVIDKLNDYTGLEDANADDDWCSRIYYAQVDYCRLSAYSRLCESCGSALSESLNSIVTAIFGVFRIKRRYPAPTDEGMETLPPLQQGYHYPQSSTDAQGRSPTGVWALYRGRIYIAPWIQSTETVVIEWNGIKRNWSDADLVDDDPKFIQTVRAHVQWQHEKAYGDKAVADQLYIDIFGTPQTTRTVGLMAELIHECHEENRIRRCEEAGGTGTGGGGARGMVPNSVTGSTGKTYYNERQFYVASCPNGQTGDSVTVIKEAGTYQSVLSVADANADAIEAAQSEANSRLVCEESAFTYYNTPQPATANCPGASDGVPAAEGNPVSYTMPAGRYGSDFSQEAADNAAYDAALAIAQANLSCTYWNSAQEYTAECPTGTVGSDVTKTVAAGTFSSTLSQEDANAKALVEAQNQAEAELSCGSDAYLIGNTPQQFPATLSCQACNAQPVISRAATIPANYLTAMTTPALAIETQLALNNAARSIAQQIATAQAQAACNFCTKGQSG